MDSSSLIALDHLNLIGNLSLLFGIVLLPKAVRAELRRRRNMRLRLRSLLRDYEFVRACEEYDPGAVELLRQEMNRRGKKDRGEMEAIVQATDMGSAVVMDDRWGRRLAERHGLDTYGTLWILKRLHEMGHLPGARFREDLLKLQRKGIRLPKEEVHSILAELTESQADG